MKKALKTLTAVFLTVYLGGCADACRVPLDGPLKAPTPAPSVEAIETSVEDDVASTAGVNDQASPSATASCSAHRVGGDMGPFFVDGGAVRSALSFEQTAVITMEEWWGPGEFYDAQDNAERVDARGVELDVRGGDLGFVVWTRIWIDSPGAPFVMIAWATRGTRLQLDKQVNLLPYLRRGFRAIVQVRAGLPGGDRVIRADINLREIRCELS